MKPLRYAHIASEIRRTKASSLLEVGTWNGERAIEMLGAALEVSSNATYYGFDLFEGITPEKSEEEFNVKRSFSMLAVMEKIKAWVNLRPGIRLKLYRGDSKTTLPRFLKKRGVPHTVDLAWIDGGHSIATIESDWEMCRKAVRPGGTILLDDYYAEVPSSLTDRFGCNLLVERLRKAGRLSPEVLPQGDPLRGGGHVHIVRMQNVFP